LSVIVSTCLVNFVHFSALISSIQQEASKSGPTAAGPTPALHIMDQGRFGFQDHPIPSAYVSSKLLQSHLSQTHLQPDLTIPPAQPYVHDRSTSQGASHSTSCGASCSISHGTSLCDTQADKIRIPATQHPIVSCDVL